MSDCKPNVCDLLARLEQSLALLCNMADDLSGEYGLVPTLHLFIAPYLMLLERLLTSTDVETLAVCLGPLSELLWRYGITSEFGLTNSASVIPA